MAAILRAALIAMGEGRGGRSQATALIDGSLDEAVGLRADVRRPDAVTTDDLELIAATLTAIATRVDGVLASPAAAALTTPALPQRTG
ncbi:MAG: hypothetical protein SF002_04860 [Alphaproteobacteria bacterium]|nr:hypothetical protein [Alphaproteobacteria bacterium]